MTARPMAAEILQKPLPDIVWDVDWSAHPLLDPSLWDRPTRLSRWAEYTWERIRDDDEAYAREAARMVRPLCSGPNEPAPSPADVARVGESLHEADVYLHSAIRLLPRSAWEHVEPLAEIEECNDFRKLLRAVFGGPGRRRFEAQRKLYLAKLLLDIDGSRPIQDGDRHLACLQDHFEDTLWRHRRQQYEVEIGYHLESDGETIRYSSRPAPGDQVFTFRSSFLEKRHSHHTLTLDVLYSSCRFKRAVMPLSFEVIEGRRHVSEQPRWREMRQHRSGSILSKMIRRGVNDPSEIADLLGAMFIVYDEEALDHLLQLLDSGVGNPFGWRNVTDGFLEDPASKELNPHAGRGYKVFKGDVDILIPSLAPGGLPYRFSAEIQVHTLQSFLRTVCVAHDAHHLALKLRQFLGGLVPYLFPAVVYGDDWLRFDPSD